MNLVIGVNNLSLKRKGREIGMAIYECKRCKSLTEVTIVGSNEEVAFCVCASCGHHDLVEHEQEQK